MQSELLASGLDQVSLNLLKYNTKESIAAAFVTGGLAYVALSAAVNSKGYAAANFNWNLISTASGLTIGALVWGEQFSDSAKLGMALGLVSLYLINK